MRSTVAATLLASCVVLSSGAQAQQLDKKEFNVIGTWNFLTPWKDLEVPFWTKELPDASAGSLKGNIKSVTEVNLKGTEVLRLLKQGVFDFAAALPIYVEDGGAVIEAVDIAGVARSFKMSREMTDAWMAEMQKIMKERHGSQILASFTWPEQNFYCKGDIKSIDDLKGKKIRVQGTSQGDLARAFGASAVTIAFGEVVPALEKGVVDCGITGNDARLQGQVARGDEHALPPAGRLHGRHLGRQPQQLEQALPGDARVPGEAVQGAGGQVLEVDRGGDRGGRGLHDGPRRGLHGRGAGQAQAGVAVRGRSQGA